MERRSERSECKRLVRYVSARLQLLGELYECARAPSNGAEGNLWMMEKAKRELRIIGDMCVHASGENWRAACSLWCHATGSTRPEEPGMSSELHGPTAAMRATAISDLGNVSSKQNALATARLAKATWIASGRPKGRGSEVLDHTQWLVCSLFDSMVKRNHARQCQLTAAINGTLLPRLLPVGVTKTRTLEGRALRTWCAAPAN